MKWLIAIWLIGTTPVDDPQPPSAYLDGGWETREACVEALGALWLNGAGAAAMTCVEEP